MDRTSAIHYIAPSSICITPNANGSPNDLAVYVAAKAKIKVYSRGIPELGIDPSTNSFREWTLSGRNRRLADGTKPYTVYARLSKTDTSDAYIVFSPKEQHGGEWTDSHSFVTNDGESVLYVEGGFDVRVTSQTHWYVKLGDVSLPSGGVRTLTLDTGILGTDQFNSDWYIDPDKLPLRVEIGCTVDDEDAGPTPYVYWGKSLVLSAVLVEGWDTVNVERFDHWEISRNSGNADADAEWNAAAQERIALVGSAERTFSECGQITLSHARGVGDDFNGAVAATFIVTAYGRPEGEAASSDSSDSYGSSDSSSSGEGAWEVLASASITVLAETAEKYEIVLSTNIVSYSPQTGGYSPAAGVTVRVRATDQRGEVFTLTRGQFDNAGLSLDYAPVGTESWTPLTVENAPSAVATAVIDTATAFAIQKSMNVRLGRTVRSDSSSSDSSSDADPEKTELALATIAFVRDGEDSKEREWIFFRSTSAVSFGNASSANPLPSLITGGEVDPDDVAENVTSDRNQDGWVPEGWYDEMHGADSTYKYEYGAYRDYAWSDDSSSSSSDDGGKRWGPFSNPVLWHQYSDGSNGSSPIQLFKWFGSSDTIAKPTVTTTQWNTGTSQALGGWSKTATDKVDGKNLYMSQNTLSGEGTIDSTAWTTPVRISGDDGDPGADAKEREWIYIGKSAQASFTGAAHPKNITTGTAGGQSVSGSDRYTTDDFVPTAWSDTAIATDDTTNKFVYASCRDWNKTTEQWGDFSDPVLWSNWGVQGIDGDGVQYTYKLFDHELTDSERTSNIPAKPASQNAAGEWIPTGWSDDPLAPTSAMPFCYCSVIKKISGTWGSFEKLGLWSKWSQDGSPWVADLDNEMDSVSCEDTSHPVVAQTVTANVSLHFGTAEKTFSITQVKRKYGSANGSTSTWSSSASSATNGVYPSWSGGALTMHYGTDAVITGKDIIEITIQATDDANISRTLTLIVNGIVGDVYNLSPSVSQVSVGSSAGSAYLWCGYTKKVNGTVTEYSLTPNTSTGLHIDSRYNIYFRRRIRAGKTVGGTTYNSETWESTYRLLTYSTNDHPTMLTALDVTVYNSVEFCLCTSTGATVSSPANVIDRETVPVLTDGEDGSNLEMYGLSPSRTSADFHRDSDASSYTPSYIDVTCGYTKTTGDGTTSYAWPASEGTIIINGSTYYIVWRKYDANGNIVATFDGAQTLGWDRSYANTDDTPNDMGDGLIRLDGGIRIKNTCTYSAIEFAIANAYARNIDSEEDIIARVTVPILRVSDGEKGDDGQVMSVIADYNGGDVSLLTFSRNYAGATIASTPSTFTLRLMSGGTEVSSLPSGCSWYKKQGSGSWSQLSSSKNVSRTQANILTDFSNGTYQTVTYGVGTSSSNILYTKLMTMRWEVQRMLVPAGEWNSTVTYTRTDNTTPLVCYSAGGTTEYWYLVADSSQGNPPYEGSTYWKKCTEFDVVLTKMLFAEFARLGSFIVYGDYFLSQYGTLVGPSSETAVTASNVNTSYSAFTPIVLNGNSVSNGIIVLRITFYATSGTTMKATIAPSSESNYDFAAIGLLGTESSPEAAMWLETASASSISSGDEGVHFLKKTSGTTSVQATLTISATGTYFIDIAYAKDSSGNTGSDNATFTFQKQSGTVTPNTMKKVVGTSGMTYEGYCQSSVPYGWFDPDDPMAETKPSAGYKFRPVKCFNALTGEEWSANGNVHTDASGNVILKNALFANSLNANTLDTQSVNGRRVHIEGGVFNIYDDNGNIGLRIGWDDDDNGAPYIVLNNADGSKSWKVTYDGIKEASASFTQDIFNPFPLNAAGASAYNIHNNTNLTTYYHFLAAKHTVTGAYSNENPQSGSSSTTWQTYREQQNNRYFTTNSKTYVISSSGSSYRIPDGYYISQAEIVQTGNVYSRYLYSADNGFVAEIGTVYYILDGSVGMWTDANGNNGRKQFDASRYITR